MPYDFMDRFQEVHSKEIANWVFDLKGKALNKKEFAEEYAKISKGKGSMCQKRKNARQTFDFIVKNGWFTEV